MEKLNISLSSTQKIDAIEIVNESLELIDIEVEDNHTFWVSEKGDDWYLTHNSDAPDIDVDVADRDKVLGVLRTEFGYNNVIPISNMNTFKVKTLVKDISKFHGISFDEANAATKTVEQEVRKATMKHGDDKNLFVLTYEDSMKHSPSFREFIERHPEVSESITILFKEQRSLGRHAGGVVILDDAPSSMPIITNGGEPQTPWVEGTAGKSLEPVGIIKYDLLGLETMRLIERTIELILKKQGLFRLKFEDGTIMTLSGEDQVKTQRGTIKVSQLKADDDFQGRA